MLYSDGSTVDDDCELATTVSAHPDKQAESAQIKSRMLRVISSLPAEQKEVFVLKEDAGLSVEQIANIIDVNVETAKSRLRYAIQKIREGLKELL